MKRTGLYGSVCCFSVNHNATAVDDILRHSQVSNKKVCLIKTMFGFIKIVFFFYSNDIFQSIKCKFFRMCFTG